MSDFSRLIQITADASQAVREHKAHQKVIRQSETALEDASLAANQYAKTTAMAGKASGGQFKNNIRFAAMQLGDLSNQLAVGGDAMRAVSLQTGNAIGMFGLYGAIIGAAVTALGSMIAGWRDARAEGEELNGTIETLLTVVDAAIAITKQFVTNIWNTVKATIEWIDQTVGLEAAMVALSIALAVKLYPAMRRVFALMIGFVRKNPILAAILAATTAIGFFADKVDLAMRAIAATWEWVAAAASNAWNQMIVVMQRGITNLQTWMGTTVNNMVNSFIDGVNAMIEAWNNSFLGQGVQFDLIGESDAGLKRVVDAMEQLAQAEAAAAESSDRLKNASDQLGDAWAALAEAFWSGDWELMPDLIEEVGGAIEDTADKAKTFAEQMSEGINNVIVGSIDGFVDTLYSSERDFGKWAQNLIIDLGKLITKMLIFQAISKALGIPFTTTPNIVGAIAGGGAGSAAGGVAAISAGAMGVASSAGASAASTGGSAGAGNYVVRNEGSKPKSPWAQPEMNVYVENHTASSVSVEQDERGARIIIEQAKKEVKDEFARSLSSGQGVYARSIDSGYTARRKL